MQTFVPEKTSYAASVQVLDRQRLGKQRVEVLQIVSALTGLRLVDGAVVPRESTAWTHHPATCMWRGHLGALYDYQVATCEEWTAGRGYRDTCRAKTLLLLDAWSGDVSFTVPPWWGDDRVHRSHRANLIRKEPERYGLLWPDVSAAEGYFWPVAA